MAENLPAALLSSLPLHSSPSLVFSLSILQHTLHVKALPLLSTQNPPDDAPVTGAAEDGTFAFCGSETSGSVPKLSHTHPIAPR